ncbi:MAG: YjbQ family protein [PVC group bacterium]|nr:YjbQ family protein [PVC group bacterium]
MEKISVKTTGQVELVDITSKIQAVVNKIGKKEGICVVFVSHTTAAVTINENADPDVRRDIIKEVNKIVPFNDGYAHCEGNSAAHIKASLFGFSETVVIEKGALQLGTWQGIYFAEFDGPRNREVWIKII